MRLPRYYPILDTGSLERMGVEDSLTQLTRRFKAIKAPAAKSFGKAAKKK